MLHYWNTQVYLCVTESNYCHIVFESIQLARLWCERNPEYHVIVRDVFIRLPE